MKNHRWSMDVLLGCEHYNHYTWWKAMRFILPKLVLYCIKPCPIDDATAKLPRGCPCIACSTAFRAWKGQLVSTHSKKSSPRAILPEKHTHLKPPAVVHGVQYVPTIYLIVSSSSCRVMKFLNHQLDATIRDINGPLGVLWTFPKNVQ